MTTLGAVSVFMFVSLAVQIFRYIQATSTDINWTRWKINELFYVAAITIGLVTYLVNIYVTKFAFIPLGEL